MYGLPTGEVDYVPTLLRIYLQQIEILKMFRVLIKK